MGRAKITIQLYGRGKGEEGHGGKGDGRGKGKGKGDAGRSGGRSKGAWEATKPSLPRLEQVPSLGRRQGAIVCAWNPFLT